MKAIFIAGLAAALVVSSTHAQQQSVGQPTLRVPARAASDNSSGSCQSAQTATKPSAAETRSAAVLALSADPVFDGGHLPENKGDPTGLCRYPGARRLAGHTGRRQACSGSERTGGGLAAQAAGDFRRSGA